MLSNLWSDLRYAARTLRRAPGFTLAAVVTIALGVGVNAGVFTVLNGVLFRDLPAPDAHELVSIAQTVEGGEFTGQSGDGTFTIAEYRAYRDRSETLAGVLAHANPTETTLGGDAPREIIGALVSCNYFDVLEQPPAVGRALAPGDCAPGADPAVLLGHDLWSTTFAADPRIVGRNIELNGQVFTVVGVAAEDAYGASPLATGYFAPLSAEALIEPGRGRFEDERQLWLYLVGRRAQGASTGQVRAELGVLAAQIDAQEPGRSTMLAVGRATPMTVPPFLRGAATGAAAVLMGAFGLILLIACANVANLMLARGTARAHEIGIRQSLGASRARVVRQLLIESLLIAVAGGLVGSAFLLWSFQALTTFALGAVPHPELPGAFAVALDFSPDARVLAFAMSLTLVTALLFGLAPALQVSKPDLNAVIKQDVAGSGAGRRGGRLRGALVGVQVALCMTLMIATGLLLRGLQSTYSMDPGFTYADVAHVSFGTDYGPAAVLDESLMDELEALPGVESTAYALQTPLGESRMGVPVRLPEESPEALRFVEYDGVTPGYFALLELPIVRGRAFTQADLAAADNSTDTRPIIVSETTARNFWGQSDPIGRTLIRQVGPPTAPADMTLEVVGVTADAQLASLGRVDPYYLFEPRRSGGELLVKTRGDFATAAASILAVVRARDPSQAVRVLALEENIGWFRGVSSLVTTLGAGLGLLALALAAVGIYAVVSYAVTRRYREIGIRMALGASTAGVLGMVLRQTLRPVAIGAVLGVAAAIVASRVLSSVLFGVSPADPLGIGGATLIVLGVAAAAGVLAARFATRTDPIAALRYE